MKRYFHVLVEIDARQTSCMKSPSPWLPTMFATTYYLQDVSLLRELMSYVSDLGGSLLIILYQYEIDAARLAV